MRRRGAQSGKLLRATDELKAERIQAKDSAKARPKPKRRQPARPKRKS